MTGDLWFSWLTGRILRPRYVEWGVDLSLHYRPCFATYKVPRPDWSSHVGQITCKLPPIASIKPPLAWTVPVRARPTTSLRELEDLATDLDEDTVEIPLVMAQKQAEKWQEFQAKGGLIEANILGKLF